MPVDVSTRYVGVHLKSPIIIASSGLTETVERMAKAQEAGAGAVVMKSLFEEEVCREAPTPRYKLIQHDSEGRETFTFFSYEQASEWGPERYAEEVIRAKKELSIKIIPSLNCLKVETWAEWAKVMEGAGADIIELNTSCPHGSITFRGRRVEETIADVVTAVKKAVKVPVVAKISPMLTSPMALVKMLADAGVEGVTIFNRMTALDIDTETEKPILHGGYAGHGGPWAILYPLRWITAIRPEVKIDISGSGGVTSGEDVVKYLLAGANAVQVCTAVYLNGFGVITKIIDELKAWMEKKGYSKLDDFRSHVIGRIVGTNDVDRRHLFRADISRDLVAPCRGECPDGVPAMGYVRMAAEGKWEQAYTLIKGHDPLQKTLGHVCSHFCETACTRALVDEAISIRGIKRAVIEWAEKKGLTFEVKKASSNGKKVAVVGSGPAGLTAAYELALARYSVTIFEKEKKAGGMLRYGIPAFRLPREVIDSDVANVTKLGVEITTNSAVNDVMALRKQYDAVVLAAGAWASHKLDIPGEDNQGVIDSLDLLYKANTGMKLEKLGKVAVIGGGNTAMDAARAAVRLGAETVYLVYRRTRDEMPAIREEIKAAEREGVRILYLAVPVEIKGTKKVQAVRIAPAYLEEPDASGRRRPKEAAEAKPYDLTVDTVVTALGQVVPDKLAGASVKNAEALAKKGIFVAGDCAHGAASIVEAVASGRKAAAMVDKFIRGKDATVEVALHNRIVEKRDVLSRVKDWREQKRVETKAASGPKTLDTIAEKTFSPEETKLEASRCLACGCGTGCDRCVNVCLYSAVRTADGRNIVDPEECDGCGLCTQICPNKNIKMVNKTEAR